MAELVIESNIVALDGEIASGFEFSHEIYGERFYLFDLLVYRLSDQFDLIPVMVSERLIDVKQDFVGTRIKVNGQFRSYNRHEGMKNKLQLSVFARDIENIDTEDPDQNSARFEGFICKDPVYRKTPLGREIADVLLAVNRPYGKSDYIPCICWGRNARFASTLTVGTHIRAYGRIQSREYTKKTEDGEVKKTAYEVSISKIETM